MCHLCVAYILVDGPETEVKCIVCQMVISKARKRIRNLSGVEEEEHLTKDSERCKGANFAEVGGTHILAETAT